jgi:hypothetical protein
MDRIRVAQHWNEPPGSVKGFQFRVSVTIRLSVGIALHAVSGSALSYEPLSFSMSGLGISQ